MTWSADAAAHGEAALVGACAGLGLLCGSISGGLAGGVRRLEPTVWPQWFMAYLVVGSAIFGFLSQGGEGVALFLAFGGIGGALPHAAGFVALRALGQALQRRRAANQRKPARSAPPQ